jgi:Na+/H+-dicarboxylate symporter
MHRLRDDWPIFLVITFVLCLLLVAYFGRSQGTSLPIPKRALDDWFAARVWWALMLGLLLGVLWARWLSNAMPHQDGVDICQTARRQFLIGLVYFALAGLLTILTDAWWIYRFRPFRLPFFGALYGVVADWRSIIMLLGYSVLFLFGGAMYFRFGRAGGLPMRYAFWTEPKID